MPSNQTLTRRGFVVATGKAFVIITSAPLLVELWSDAQPAAANGSKSQYDFFLEGYAQSEAFRGYSERNRTALEILGRIYDLTSRAHSPEVKEVTDEIQRQIATGKAVAPDLFANMANLGTASDWQKSAEEIARFFGIGAQAGAALIPIFEVSPAAGAALAFGSVILEPALQFALKNLPYQLPSISESDLAVISTWAYSKFIEVAQRDPEFKRFTIDSNAVNLIGIDLSTAPTNAVSKLPSPLNEGTRQNDAAARQAIEIALRSKVTESTKQIEKEIRAISDLQKTAVAEWKREQELQAHLQKIQRNYDEMVGLAKLGGSFLAWVVGDANASKVFVTAVSTVSDVYKATALFDAGKIGILSFAGTVFGAAQALSTIMSPGIPLEAMILEALKQISDQLRTIQIQLNRIEQLQSLILKQLADIYIKIEQNHQEAVGLISEVQQTLVQLGSTVVEGEKSDFEKKFLGTIDQISSLLRLPDDQRSNDVSRESIRRYLTDFYSLATNDARTSALAGEGQQAFSLSQAKDIIQQRRSADALFGCLPRLLRLVGVEWPEELSQAAAGNLIANPLAWARSVDCYLQARVLASTVAPGDIPIHTTNLWREGVRVKNAAQKAGDYRSLRAAADSLKIRIENVRRECEQVGLEIESQRLSKPRNVFPGWATLKGNWAAQGEDRAYYSPGDYRFLPPVGQTFLIYCVDHDPVSTALRLGIVEKKPMQGVANVYQLIQKVGKNAGKTLFEPSAEFPDGGLMYETQWDGPLRGWNTRTWETSKDPEVLFERCAELVRRHHDTTVFAETWPGAVRNRLNAQLIPDGLTTEFDGAGTILRLFATIALWRQGYLATARITPDIANVIGSFTAGNMEQLATSVATQMGELNGGWARTASAKLAELINGDVERLVSMSLGLADSQGLPEVDSALRRLGAYMLSSGIEIPRSL